MTGFANPDNFQFNTEETDENQQEESMESYRLTWHQTDRTDGYQTCYSEDSAMSVAKQVVASGVTKRVTITKVEKIAIVQSRDSKDVYVDVKDY